MFEFPKWKYSVTGSVLVNSAEEESALIGAWFDFPADVDASVADQTAAAIKAAEQAALDLDNLRATANSMGIAVDGRWGAQRLEDEIKASILASGNTPAAAPAVDAVAPATEA